MSGDGLGRCGSGRGDVGWSGGEKGGVNTTSKARRVWQMVREVEGEKVCGVWCGAVAHMGETAATTSLNVSAIPPRSLQKRTHDTSPQPDMT